MTPNDGEEDGAESASDVFTITQVFEDCLAVLEEEDDESEEEGLKKGSSRAPSH